jgi:hypothetical protein
METSIMPHAETNDHSRTITHPGLAIFETEPEPCTPDFHHAQMWTSARDYGRWEYLAEDKGEEVKQQIAEGRDDEYAKKTATWAFSRANAALLNRTNFLWWATLCANELDPQRTVEDLAARKARE